MIYHCSPKQTNRQMTLQEKIDVMMHFDDAGKVQSREIQSRDVWRDAALPCWDWVDFEYRKKPEAKTEQAIERFFDTLIEMVDNEKVTSQNLFEHLGKKLRPKQ